MANPNKQPDRVPAEVDLAIGQAIMTGLATGAPPTPAQLSELRTEVSAERARLANEAAGTAGMDASSFSRVSGEALGDEDHRREPTPEEVADARDHAAEIAGWTIDEKQLNARLDGEEPDERVTYVLNNLSPDEEEILGRIKKTDR